MELMLRVKMLFHENLFDNFFSWLNNPRGLNFSHLVLKINKKFKLCF